MSLTLGDIVPDPGQDATAKPFPLHDGAGEPRIAPFSHPWDVTLSCAPEPGSVVALRTESDRREAAVVARPIDPLDRDDDGLCAAGRDASLPRLRTRGWPA